MIGAAVGAVLSVAADRALPDTEAARRKASELRRDRRISTELGPVETEFNDALAERIESRAKDVDDFDLHSIAMNWEAIADEIDAHEVVCESEEDAVEWLVEEIVTIEDVELDKETEEELEILLAEEFGNAVDAFRERIASDGELANRFQTTLELDMLEELRRMSGAFDRLADRRPYGLHEFPAERDAAVETLLPGDPIEFVDRPEVPAEPEPGRYFVLGPSGAGKSRIIAERLARLPEDAVEYVLVPEDRLLDPADARALARESFEGDLLLVWEDVHRIDEAGENTVLERVVVELRDALEEQGHDLYTLFEAQSGKLDTIPGNLPADFENDKSVWHAFEPLWVGEMSQTGLREMAETMAVKHEVDLSRAARDALVERTRTSESAPIYLETVLRTAGGRLTREDIEALPDAVSDIWERQYDHLQDDALAEWRVLAAMALLYDLNVPRYSKLVRVVYLELLDGDRGQFRTAVRALRETRQWLTVSGDALVAVETTYDVHDTQLDAVRVSARDDASPLSELLVEHTESAVPSEAERDIHFYAGLSLYEWECYVAARDQWRRTIDVDSQDATAHYNYALLLSEELGWPEEAAEHYQRAIDINPQYAEAHYNYGNLLYEELGRPEEAADHYERAIDINPQFAEAHSNYALLLSEELGSPEEAAEHYQRAIDINPQYAKAHSNSPLHGFEISSDLSYTVH